MAPQTAAAAKNVCANQWRPQRMNQPGVSGEWSMGDIVAHLTGWQQRLAAQIQAGLAVERK
jgi:hypothetical protein